MIKMKKILLIQFILSLAIFSCFGQETRKTGEQNKTKNDMIFVVVEEMPTFKGGDVYAFRDWVQERVRYPEELKAQKVEGKVYIMFVVETDGSVSNVQVMRGIHPLLDKESVKVVESSPKWKPGLQLDKAVRVRFSITVEYNLI